MTDTELDLDAIEARAASETDSAGRELVALLIAEVRRLRAANVDLRDEIGDLSLQIIERDEANEV